MFCLLQTSLAALETCILGEQPWEGALLVVCTPFWDSLLWGILVLIWHKEHQGNKN